VAQRKTLEIRRSPHRSHPARRRGVWRGILLAAVFAGVLAGSYFLIEHFNLFGLHDVALEQLRSEQLSLETKPVTEQDKDTYTVAPAYPRYLTIDAAGIKKARVMALGLLKPDSSGAQQIDAPKNIYDVGWWNCQINPVASKKCAQPILPGGGDTSSAAVIDGHSCTGQNCVFNNLPKLKAGDKIVVERGDGTTVNYTVREVDIVPLNQIDMNRLMKPLAAGREGLNLITCAGSWTAKDAQGVPTMDKRVMVFAIRD